MGFFLPSSFLQISSRKEKCRRQTGQALGRGSEGTRGMWAERSLPLAWGSLQYPGRRETSPSGSRQKTVVGEGGCPQISGSTVPLALSQVGSTQGPIFGGVISKAWAHRGQTEGRRQEGPTQKGSEFYREPSWNHRRPGGQGQPGLFPACQPMSFFRKASSWSSSLMPTNLSTTSPFLMASTVGTADTYVEETKGDQVTRRRTFLSSHYPAFMEKAGGVCRVVTA